MPSGEGKRRNECAEWHVAWLAERHHYAGFNLWKMVQRNKLDRKACARLCRAFLWRQFEGETGLISGAFITSIKTRLKLKHC